MGFFCNCSINNKPISQDKGRPLWYMTGAENFHQHLKIIISALFFSINLEYRRTYRKKEKKNTIGQIDSSFFWHFPCNNNSNSKLLLSYYFSYCSFVLKTILKRKKKKIHVYLYGQHHKSNTDHNDNKQLWRPYLGCNIPKAHSRKCHYAEIKGVKESQPVSCSFQMLNSTNTT